MVSDDSKYRRKDKNYYFKILGLEVGRTEYKNATGYYRAFHAGFCALDLCIIIMPFLFFLSSSSFLLASLLTRTILDRVQKYLPDARKVIGLILKLIFVLLTKIGSHKRARCIFWNRWNIVAAFWHRFQRIRN